MRKMILIAVFGVAASAAQATQKGITPSGLHFTVYNDGEATISRVAGPLETDWKVKCSADKMNDKIECFVAAKRSPLVIEYGHSEKPQHVCVAGHDFPGRTAMIRAGNSKPVTTGKTGCLPASRILPSLLASDVVATRKYHWPYAAALDESGTLIGIRDAMDLVSVVRRQRAGR